MNTSILKKCIAELQKETPDLSYLRGMLETLLEMQGSDSSTSTPTSANIFDGMGTYYTNALNPSMPSMQPLAGSIDKSPEGMAVDAALASLQGVKPRPETLIIEKNINLN